MPYDLRPRKAPESAPAPPNPPKRKAPTSAPPTRKKIPAPSSSPPSKKKNAASVSPPPRPPKKKTPAPSSPPPPKKKAPAPVSPPSPKKEPPAPESPATKNASQSTSPSPSPPKKKSKKETTAPQVSNQLAFGSDCSGELGLGKIGFDKKNPIRLPLQEHIKQVACGAFHTISLTENGQVYSYGCNDDGALGRVTNGEEKLEATPTLVELDDKVTKITAGDSHCAALTDKMEVYIWGNFRDENAMVGLMPECEGKAIFKPTKVKLDKRIKDIASGGNHMLLLDVDGVIYSFGVGNQGQLGRLKPEDCAKSLSPETRELFLVPKPVDMSKVDPMRPFVGDAIFAGEYTSYAINTDKKKNRTAAWGLNNYHQLGYKGTKNQLAQHYPRRSTFTCATSMINIAAGQHHTIFLTKTGRVYSAGATQYGVLGIGAKASNREDVCPALEVTGFDSPVKVISVGSRTSFAVTNTGKLYSWGMSGESLGVDSDSDLKEPTFVEKLGAMKVISVSASGNVTAVIVEQS